MLCNFGAVKTQQICVPCTSASFLLHCLLRQLTNPRSLSQLFVSCQALSLLQESLGGNSKITLIIACSPSVDNPEETVATFRFAERVVPFLLLLLLVVGCCCCCCCCFCCVVVVFVASFCSAGKTQNCAVVNSTINNWTPQTTKWQKERACDCTWSSGQSSTQQSDFWHKDQHLARGCC